MERSTAHPLNAIQVKTQIKNLGDHLNAVRRRRGPLILSIFIGLVIVGAAVLLWPPTFQSTGTVLIEQQEVPTDLVRSTITSFADQRIQVITQRVMTVENLIRIVQRYDLYPDLRKKKTREVVIARMRQDVGFEMISANVIDPRAGVPIKATIAFTVSYSNRSPEIAARVANELVSLYLQENMDSRKQHAVGATKFLTDQADLLEKEIAELAGKLADFKERNADNLPQVLDLNRTIMNRSQDEMQEIDARVRSIDQQLTYLDAQLAQINPVAQVYTSTGERVMSPSDRLKYLRTEYVRASALYSPTHPDVVRLKNEMAGMEKTASAADAVNDLQRQLEDAKTQLASAKEHYAATHPDVVRLEQLIAGLNKQLTDALKNDASAKKETEEPDNPAYITIKSQREASMNERTSLLIKRKETEARMREYEKRIAGAPGVEREYMQLAGDLDNTQLKYQQVRQKQMEAQQSQNLEEDRKGEHFTLIEPPLVPQEPASPNRALIVIMGVVLTLAFGAGVVVLCEMLDGSLHGKYEVEALLSVAPLAVLPYMENSDERVARARTRRYSIAGATAAMVIAITLIHFLYRPLDVLWQVALRRLSG